MIHPYCCSWLGSMYSLYRVALSRAKVFAADRCKPLAGREQERGTAGRSGSCPPPCPSSSGGWEGAPPYCCAQAMQATGAMRLAFLLLLVASPSATSFLSAGAMKKACLTTRAAERRCGKESQARVFESVAKRCAVVHDICTGSERLPKSNRSTVDERLGILRRRKVWTSLYTGVNVIRHVPNTRNMLLCSLLIQWPCCTCLVSP